MPPRKEVARDADGEEQFGMFRWRWPCKFKLMIAVQARFILSPGMRFSWAA
jgi:hypothetical protein